MPTPVDPIAEEMTIAAQAGVNAVIAQQGAVAPTGAVATTDAGVLPQSVAYGVLQQRNPLHDGEYWEECEALYSGGRKLFGNKALFERLFPKHRDEHESVYAERKRRAFYIPYPAEILDFIVAQLMSEPFEVKIGSDDDSTKATETLPPFYKAFLENSSAPGGEKTRFSTLIRDQVLKALQVRSAWTLCEMPSGMDDSGQPIAYDSLGDQEKAGGLQAWAVPIDPISIVDWKQDATGELEWILIATEESERDGILGSRGTVTERWMYYTRDEWAQYEVTRPRDRPLKNTDPVPMKRNGRHTFGRVPVCRMCLPDGLWAMDKLSGLAREHLNKRSGLSWAEFQSLMQELYEYLAPESPTAGALIGANQENPGRAFAQRRGQGFVQTRGHQDKAEFVGPDAAPFAHAMASCRDIRDEMHRVTHQMALTIDNSAAALGRSAESKSHDKGATAVILVALGAHVRDHVRDILNMISRGRGDGSLDGKWRVSGMDDYEPDGTGDLIEQAVSLSTVTIKSPTFNRLHQFMMAKSVLGNIGTAEILERVEKEIEENVTAEEFAPSAGMNMDPVMDDGTDGTPPIGRPVVPPGGKAPPRQPPKG